MVTPINYADPKLQAWAYVTDGTTLVEVIGLKPESLEIVLQDAATDEIYVIKIREVLQHCRLVKEAPVCPLKPSPKLFAEVASAKTNR